MGSGDTRKVGVGEVTFWVFNTSSTATLDYCSMLCGVGADVCVERGFCYFVMVSLRVLVPSLMLFAKSSPTNSFALV